MQVNDPNQIATKVLNSTLAVWCFKFQMIMVVGTYTLDLYCDNFSAHPLGYYTHEKNFPIQYVADGLNSYSIVRKQAKKSGWILKRDGTCICPICRKNGVFNTNR